MDFKLFLLIALTVVACGGRATPEADAAQDPDIADGADSEDDAVEPKVRENVRVVDPALASLTDRTATTLTFTGSLPALKAGDVVVGAEGGGFARKVESVAVSGDETVVTASQQASIEEVFEQARIELGRKLALSDFEQVEILVPGVTFGDKADSAGFAIPIHFEEVVFDTPQGNLQASGVGSIELGIDGVLITKPFGLEHVRVAPYVSANLTLTLSGAIDIQDSRTIAIANLIGSPMVIPVGGVPVVLRPSLQISMQFSGLVKGFGKATLHTSLLVKGGFEWRDGQGFSPLVETDLPAPTFTPAGSFRFELDLSPLHGFWQLTLWESVSVEATTDLPKLHLGLLADESLGSFEIDAWIRYQMGLKAYARVFGAAIGDTIDLPKVVDVLAWQWKGSQPFVVGGQGKIVYEAGGDLWLMNADGTGSTNLTSSPSSEYQPTLSPNRGKVAFVQEGIGALFVINADGSGKKAVAPDLGGSMSGPSFNNDPAWSPAGSHLAFSSTDAGPAVLWLVQLATMGYTQITEPTDGYADEEPVFTLDGARIVYAHDDSLRMLTPGETPVTLHSAPGRWPRSPAISPDGKRLAFTQVDPDSGGKRRAYLASLDAVSGTMGEPVVFTGEGWSDVLWPCFSPAGSQLLLVDAGVGQALGTLNVAFVDKPEAGAKVLGPDVLLSNPDWR